jgi:glycosyltransferase involved in cell wall biosynthesis
MSRFRLVAVDLVLRAPQTAMARLKAAVLRLLFSRVDRFIFYFNRLEGYQRFFGIGPDRAVYVPFKVNDWDKIHLWSDTSSDGDYVMCAGRTMRDVNTFVEAIRRAGCPGLLHQQKGEVMAEHGTQAWKGELPPNLELVVDDSYRHEVFLDFIAKARIVVIPRFRNDIGPAGIATYLVAMALNKCVIISEGPGAEDVLTDQAVIVPPEDPERLAEQITLHWDDHGRRSEIAARGAKYARSLEGEKRLLSDILRVSTDGLR